MNIFFVAVVFVLLAVVSILSLAISTWLEIKVWLVMSLTGPLVVGGLILGWNKQRKSALPICRRGNCSVDDYHFVSAVDGNVQYQCRCGDIYLMNGRRLFTLNQEGKPIRYKVKRFLRGWINDSDLPLP